MEVTGVYHESLLYYLYDCKVEVCLEMPKKVKRYLESLGQKTKTDKEDSKGIAQMACERKLKRWKPLSTNIRELRAVIRYRKSLIMSKNQFSNRMHAISVSTLDSKKVKKSLTAMIKRLAAEIKKMEKDAIALMKKDKPVYEKAKMISDSINGLGIMSILAVLSETNGFEEITSQKQLESYAGFDIIENSSGEHQGKTKISKQGNVHLRTSMYMPVVSMLSHKPKIFYDLYKRLKARNGGLSKKAMVAVQRKLLVMIYTLWKKNEAFDPDYASKKRENAQKQIVPT